MSTLQKSPDKNQVAEEEQPAFLCSNKVLGGCCTSEFTSNDPLPTEDILLDQLAELMVEIYLESKGYKDNDEECSDLLPGINKRTSRRGQQFSIARKELPGIRR